MDRMFDFGDAKSHEETLYRTWSEFRDALASGKFKYNDIDLALKENFLHVFNDMFEINGQKKWYAKTFDLVQKEGWILARGAKLKDSNPVDYDRFSPKSEFIKEDNRFSPKGVEWLYIAMGETEDIAETCTMKECKVTSGKYFGICRYEFDGTYADRKLVDLTIVDDCTYADINSFLEEFGQVYAKVAVEKSIHLGRPVQLEENIIKGVIERWAISYYTKLLATRIFEPVDVADKELMYAPFHCLAYYFMKLGFDGIIYSSTVYPEAKDIVLFDKKYAMPIGDIKYQVIP